MSFAAPAMLFGLLALPLVVLLHRLRVRRERRPVAGTFLWRQARERGQSAPRWRSSLLLLLQLLAVTVLVVAAAQPRLGAAEGPLRVLVIDASVGMHARDGASSEVGEGLSDLPADATRLEVAARAAARLLSEPGPVAIVRIAGEPELALAPTHDLDAAREVLADLHAFHARTEPERALVMARDLAAGHAGSAELHWFASRPPPSVAGVQLWPLAGRGHNVGISGFERIADQAWVRLTSTYPGPQQVPVRLVRDGVTLSSTTLTVPGRGSAAATLMIGGTPGEVGAGAIQARIDPPEGDVLSLDDEGWAPGDRVRIVLDRTFAAFERAALAMPGVQLRVVSPSAARTMPAELRVLHGVATAPANTAAWLLPEREGPATAVRTWRMDTADPLLRFVDLRDLVVAVPDPPPFGEEPGWRTVVSGVPLGEEDAAPLPLLQVREGDGPPTWRSAFHPLRGELTVRAAFPALVVNMVESLRGAARVPLGGALPEGATRDDVAAAVAERPGPYLVNERIVTASVLREEATRLPGPDAFPPELARAPTGPADSAALEEGATETRAGASLQGIPWWAPLLLAAAVLLALEWWGHATGFRALPPSVPWARRDGSDGW